MTAKTNAQYLADYRKRKKALGLKEVYGIYLPPALHPELKAAAKRMLVKHEKTKGAK